MVPASLVPSTIDEAVVRAANVASYKWDLLRQRPWAFFLNAFAGGAMVVFGAMLALSVSAGITIPGLANLVMGLVFGFSLVIIMISGMCLITADMALGVFGVFHRRMTWLQYLYFIVMGYIGNFAGSMFFMYLVYLGGSVYNLPPWLLRAHAIAAAKTGMSDLNIFVLGILCTWFLQTAMMLYYKAGTDIGKMMMAYYGPLAFVAGMTEHCIANIGFLALPLFQQKIFTKVTGVALTAAGPTARLSWGFAQFGWAHNQLFTVMGNLVGGIVFVTLVFQFVSNPQRVMLLYRTTKARMLRI